MEKLDEFEKSAIRAAYESLPDRWRTVLWHLDVEGRKPQELGPLLDMSANSVSALVYRARSGLREAYLHQHVKDDETSERVCRAVRGKLPGFVRRAASARDQEKVHGHLEACPACMAVYLDLQEVNREVGAIVAPTSLAVSLSGAALAAGGLAVGAGGLAALCTHIAVVSKGAAMMVAPPMAAAALTTATVIGVASPDIIDPPRTPLGSFGSSTHEPDSHPADQADRVHDRTRLVTTVDRSSGTGGVDEVPMPDGVETPDGSRIPTAVAGSVEPAPAPVVKSGGGLPLPKLEPVRLVSPTVQGLTAAGASAAGSVSSTVKDTVTVLPGIVGPLTTG